MIDDGWPFHSNLRLFVVIIALCIVVYLLFQTRTPPVQLSSWPGNQTGDIRSDSGPVPIAGEAVPQSGRGLTDPNPPAGNPLGMSNTVMTQGYGTGSHAPAAIWGAIDLAIDSNGDGAADPDGTWNTPIYATHGGVARVSRDTWPAGNHIWVDSGRYRTGYAHIQEFAVEDGQPIQRGQIIGYVGSTGQSSGPHLDYQVWQDGINVNPLEFGALDGAGG